jgi:hypothetical protein
LIRMADVTDTVVFVGDEIVKRHDGGITNRNCVLTLSSILTMSIMMRNELEWLWSYDNDGLPIQ